MNSLTPKAQVALLRVLQEQRYRPLGASHEYQANVRIVTATNVPLDQLVQAGTFRVDLYYRLCVFVMHLPSLRERKQDIPTLAAHFLWKHTPAERATLRLAPSALAALMAAPWPGNIRELENAIIRGVHLCQTVAIEAADLGLEVQSTQEPLPTFHAMTDLPVLKTLKRQVIETFERDYLTRLLCIHQGNVSHAARMAGKERRELGKLLKKYHIDPTQFYVPAFSMATAGAN